MYEDATVRVRCVEARNLPKADTFGLSDPFCEVKIGMPGTSGKSYYGTKKTQIIKKTLNPYWDEEFVMRPQNPATESVDIFVYDWDRFTRNDLLGFVSFPVASLQLDQPVDRWYPLHHPKKSRAGGFGDLHLIITYTNPDAKRTRPPAAPAGPAAVPVRPGPAGAPAPAGPYPAPAPAPAPAHGPAPAPAPAAAPAARPPGSAYSDAFLGGGGGGGAPAPAPGGAPAAYPAPQQYPQYPGGGVAGYLPHVAGGAFPAYGYGAAPPPQPGYGAYPPPQGNYGYPPMPGYGMAPPGPQQQHPPQQPQQSQYSPYGRAY